MPIHAASAMGFGNLSQRGTECQLAAAEFVLFFTKSTVACRNQFFRKHLHRCKGVHHRAILLQFLLVPIMLKLAEMAGF
jgi:hypothetical protein